MKKVLITKLASMGDLVHLLPALTDAKRAYPEISFDWLIDKKFYEIATWHPAVDKVILTDHRTWRSNITAKKTRREVASVIRQMNETKYDLIIDAQGNIKSAILSLFANGKIAGFDGKSIPEWGAHFLYKKKAKVPKKSHAVSRLRTLLASSLNYPLENEISYLIDETKLIEPKISLPPSFLLFIPIASHSSKLWKEENWMDLITKAKELSLPILIPSGSAKEEARAKRLAIHEGVIALPRLSLSEIGYIVKKAKAMVSLDTGISHIAAALSTPCVSLYGPTDPKTTGTLGKNQTWISKSTLEEITPDHVLRELVQHLNCNHKNPAN
jgi:heptosyltransferase I